MQAARAVACLLSLTVLVPAQILFDTDSGFFGDDGVALVMLMRSARAAEIHSISVVAGNVWAPPGAEYMRRTLKLLGRDKVAVRVGAQRPLVHAPAMVAKEAPIEFSGALGIAPVPLVPSTAVQSMAREIEAAPGRVTIFAIGPMTNVALLLTLRPDLEAKIAALVFMGGNVHVPGNASKSAEFNFWFDPEAARIVLRSAIPNPA